VAFRGVPQRGYIIMNPMLITHGCYLVLGLAATLAVVWTLQRRGLTFLIRWCGGDEALAAAWNHLLAVGSCLLQVGCLLLALRYGGQAATEVEAVELLSTKIGLVLFALAATHFLHLKAYWAMHRAAPKPQPAAVDAVIVAEAAR
jgi:hypothetical protein